MATSRIATALVASLCIAVAAGVAYGIHKVTKERNEQRAVVSMVSDTTAYLRSSLKSASPEVLEKIEGSLRVTKTWNNAELAEATEEYLVGAREIMRRRADANRLTHKAAVSRAALVAHMQRSAGRDTPWIHTASMLKRQVERDHFDLDVQLKALADLFELLPHANKRLAPHVQASLLLQDEARKSAHREVLEEQKRASAELQKVRSLLPR
jgi:hypothetical protein